jgi:hypothetical protein
MSITTYSGSCHCGAVRFEADLDLSKGTTRCNCSICTKARSWFVMAPPERVRLLSGEGAQTDYQWVPPARSEAFLHFRFCKTCGIRTFGRGGEEGQEGGFYFVNVAALDGVDPDALAARIRQVDGRNDHYDQVPADTRLM